MNLPGMKISDSAFGFLMFLPALVLIFLIVIFPIGHVVYLSFFKNIIMGKTFAGVENYVKIFSNRSFWKYLQHTGIYATTCVSLTFGIGLTAALLLNRMHRGTNIMRALLILPWAIPPIIASFNWRLLLLSAGVVNEILQGLYLTSTPIRWLSRPTTAMISIIICDVWVNTPFVFIILLAALQTIPEQLWDAALIDGANRSQYFWHVALPLLKPAILIVVSLRTVFALRSFDIPFGLTKGGPGDATKLLSQWIYEQSFYNIQLGYASALSVILTFIGVGIVLIYLKTLD